MAPSPAALIVVRPPKNQRCSPVPGCCAMGVSVVMGAACSLAGPHDHPPRAGIFLARRGRLGSVAGSVEQLVDEIDRLSARALPRKEFFAELAPRLRGVIGNDASCWHTLDPSTRLLTSDDPTELIGHGIISAEEAPGAGELLV